MSEQTVTQQPAADETGPLIGDGIEVPCPRCQENRVRIVVSDVVDGTAEMSCLGCHVIMMAQVASAIGSGAA